MASIRGGKADLCIKYKRQYKTSAFVCKRLLGRIMFRNSIELTFSSLGAGLFHTFAVAFIIIASNKCHVTHFTVLLVVHY